MLRKFFYSLLIFSLFSGYTVAMEQQTEQANTHQTTLKRKHTEAASQDKLPPKKKVASLENNLETGEKEIITEDTPISASPERHKREVETILAMGKALTIDPELFKKSLREVVDTHSNETIRTYLSRFKGDYDDRDKDGKTALYIAVENDKEPSVNALATHGADANITDLEGFSPLHIAIKNNYPLIIQCLLGHAAAVNTRTSTNTTPLHAAVANKNLSAVKLLLDANADINAIDTDNKTPMTLVIESEDVHLLKLFGDKLIQGNNS